LLRPELAAYVGRRSKATPSKTRNPMTKELTWAIIGAVATIVSIVVALIFGFPTLADWIIKMREHPDLRVLAQLYNPVSVAGGYTYLRVDTAVVNNGNTTASNIIVKLSSPPTLQTVAEYFRGRQATTPGEGEFNMSIAPVEPDGYRTATHMLSAPPLQGGAVVQFSSGTTVLYAQNGHYVFRWSVHCPEDRGRGTLGTFAIDVLNGVATLKDAACSTCPPG
jgi:hypothetical protein